MEERVASASKIQTGHDSLLEFARSITDSSLTVICLIASAMIVGSPFRPAELVLAVLTFSFTYPNTVPFSHRPRDMIGTVLGTWLSMIAILLFLGLVTGLVKLFDRDTLILWGILTPAAQITVHWFSPIILRRVMALRVMRRVVIVGANDLGKAFARSVADDPVAHSQVLTFFDDRDVDRLGEMSNLSLSGRISAVGPFVRANKVDQIFIALPMASQPRILDLLNDLRDTTASIYFLPDIFMFDLIQARVDTLSNFPVVAVCESPFQGTRGALKRAFDVLISLLALALTAPFMLAIALAVKWTSPGPVIFKQRRFGLDGREIIVYKFRSMTVTEDGDSDYKQVERGDDRVTPLGAFLRRSSLDELPQFLNVLQGRMSVVGPRPHAIAVNDQYRKLIPGYMIRHKVRPGITGWAQINGYRGGDDLGSMSKRIEFDLDYLRNWSIWLDLRIIARTVGIVVKDTKAY